MQIKPLNGDDTEAIHLPVPTKSQGKTILKESYAVLDRLDKYDSPDTPTETYLDKQSGKYVRMLEGLLDVAAENGLIETSSVILFGLLRLTKAGRTKTDVSVTGVSKLRDELDVSDLSDEELAKLAAKAKIRA